MDNKRQEKKPRSQHLPSPLSDYETKIGKKEDPRSSFRWLAEWSSWEKERLKVLEKRAKF